jgi:hypothetical protein
MLRARFRRLPAACVLFFLLFVRTASAANRWGESNWGELLWGGGGAALPALGARELVVLAALLLTTGILLTRRMLKRRTGEER